MLFRSFPLRAIAFLLAGATLGYAQSECSLGCRLAVALQELRQAVGECLHLLAQAALRQPYSRPLRHLFGVPFLWIPICPTDSCSRRAFKFDLGTRRQPILTPFQQGWPAILEPTGRLTTLQRGHSTRIRIFPTRWTKAQTFQVPTHRKIGVSKSHNRTCRRTPRLLKQRSRLFNKSTRLESI